MLRLESGVEVPIGSLMRFKSDPEFPNWDEMYAGKLVLLVGEEWLPSLNDYLYIVLVDGKLMHCERTDFDEEYYPG